MKHSYLFVPGNQYSKMEKAKQSEADILIIDLEDSVPLDKKDEARDDIANFLKDNEPLLNKLYIRINDMNTNFWRADLELINRFSSVGIVLPMAESADHLEQLNEALRESRSIIPIIETAKGVHLAHEIAAAKNVKRLAFGALDYAVNLGVSDDAHEIFNYTRSKLLIASRMAHIDNPIDSVFPNFTDDAALKSDLLNAEKHGFYAKLCIHPRQLKIVNEFYRPSEAEVDWANKVIDSFESAEKEGIASINIDGEMVDYPVYKRAQQILQRYKR